MGGSCKAIGKGNSDRLNRNSAACLVAERKAAQQNASGENPCIRPSRGREVHHHCRRKDYRIPVSIMPREARLCKCMAEFKSWRVPPRLLRSVKIN